ANSAVFLFERSLCYSDTLGICPDRCFRRSGQWRDISSVRMVDFLGLFQRNRIRIEKAPRGFARAPEPDPVRGPVSGSVFSRVGALLKGPSPQADASAQAPLQTPSLQLQGQPQGRMALRSDGAADA